MQLSVPQRGVADAGSFPLDPDAVSRWLRGLAPLASERDAREVLRGLKHSNRLHADPDRRRAVLERFAPVLDALHEQLSEPTRAQPLPLARGFARTASLVEALLREEAFAFKILLNDSARTVPEDARRAMQALAHRADLAVHGYRGVPEELLAEAHELYALALSGGRLESSPDPSVPALLDHYRYLLALAIADTRQIRARQLPLALDFLREAAAEIVLERVPTEIADVAVGATTHALGLRADSARPERVTSLLPTAGPALHVFDAGRLLARIDAQIARTRTRHTNVLGVDALERQTLGRLRGGIARDRERRAARTIANLPQPALFGHREITTRLLFDARERADEHSAREPEAAAAGAPAGGSPDPGAPAGWTLLNRSAQGACLRALACPPGSVEVGELVALIGGDAPRSTGANGRRPVLVGSVRWVHAHDDSGITLGVEYLARGVVPVRVTRADDARGVAENAMILACKVQREIVQTILLPPYLHRSGERLRVTREERSLELTLRTCLQANGLFGHFLTDRG